jgi:hypothetical protein
MRTLGKGKLASLMFRKENYGISQWKSIQGL